MVETSRSTPTVRVDPNTHGLYHLGCWDEDVLCPRIET